jgi:hypothetical protein
LSDIADPAWRELTADIRHALTHRVGLSDVAVLMGAHEIPTTVSGADVFGPLFGDLVGQDEYARHEYERNQLPIDRRETLQRYYLLKLRDALTNAACHLGRYDFTRREFTPSCAILPSWGGDRRLKFPGDLEWRIAVPEDGARDVESAWRARRLVAEVVFHVVRVGDGELHVRIDAAIVEDQRTGDVVHRQMPEQLRPLRR